MTPQELEQAMARRTWQVKMLALARQELADRAALYEGEPEHARGPSWTRLVSFAVQFGGEASPRPTRDEFDMLRGLTVEELLMTKLGPQPARVRVFHNFDDPRRQAGRIAWDRLASGPLAVGTLVELFDHDGNTMQGTVERKYRDAPAGGALWFVDEDPDSWKPGLS